MNTRSTSNRPSAASARHSNAPARKPRTTRSTRDTANTSTSLTRMDLSFENQQEHHRHEGAKGYNGNLAVASKEEPDFGEHEEESINMDTHRSAFGSIHGGESQRPRPNLTAMQSMAERVGREVEAFAENLDQFLDNLPTRNKFEAVIELVHEFKQMAKDAAYSLKKTHQQQWALQLREEWGEKAHTSSKPFALSSRSNSRPKSSLTEAESASVRDLRRHQQEADIWDLFELVLTLHHNPNKQAIDESREEQLHNLGPIHRYSTENDKWKHFLLHDDLAKERSMIKSWLEQTAEHQESGLDGIMQELQSSAKGPTSASRGWMYTRERIKAEKRMRSWPTAPGAPLPQIRTKSSQLVIAALDPDAPSRQTRGLEEQDQNFERSMWIACWEMLRRGQSWQEVSEWCLTRNEGWRAMSVGKASDSADVLSNTTWRKMCYIASQASGSIDYEAAVYGLLGGSTRPVRKVCHTVDDRLYAHYNAALICQFEQYLAANFPSHTGSWRANEDALKDPQEQIVDLILKLRKEPETSTESIQPMKIIQSYLLANDVGSMIHTMGFAIAYTDHLRVKGEDMIVHLRPFWPEDANQPEAEIALDPQTLRIATHMSILLRELTNEKLDGEEKDAEENVTVAYIQALRAAGKRDLIPIYASRLKVGRYVVTMGRILEDVTSASEQETMLNLLQSYGLDNILILNEQLSYLLNEYIAPSLHNPRPLKMLEDVDDTHLYPKQRIIEGFLPTSTTNEDMAIVRSLQWYSIINGYWKETFYHLSLALRKCLVAGRLACALSIVFAFPYETVAIRKSYQTMGKSINPMEHGQFPANEQATWELFMRQSKTYHELEHLVRAIKALSEWRIEEADCTAKKGNHLNLSTPLPSLRTAKEEVDEAMSLILSGRILQESLDPDEAADLDFIRMQYIPEIIIAYNTVLHSAGSLLSRDHLIESMDLSVTVADEANGLAECFTASRRMRELVTSFAQTSKTMLVMKPMKQWKPRKGKEGKDLGMWETSDWTAVGGEGDNREVSL